MEGAKDGAIDGFRLGEVVRTVEGLTVGTELGDEEGARVGTMEGAKDGAIEGFRLGEVVRTVEGLTVGTELGDEEGARVGTMEGAEDGAVEGFRLGGTLGKVVGAVEGFTVGTAVGDEEGALVGTMEGAKDGAIEGFRLDKTVGFEVGERVVGERVGALLGYEQMTLLTENDPVKVFVSSHVPSAQVLIKQIAVKPLLDRGELNACVTCMGVLT